jgi:hypothetical protein
MDERSGSEALAEGGVERFLAAIAPALERYGVVLQVETIEQPYRRPDDHMGLPALPVW